MVEGLTEGPEKVFQETEETVSCYRCRKPLDDYVEIKRICEDCLKLESVEVQRAFRKLKEANTIARLHQNLSETLSGYPQTPTPSQKASEER